MSRAVANRFDSHCREMGCRKSPLIARLVRDHLDSEAFDHPPALFDQEQQGSGEQ